MPPVVAQVAQLVEQGIENPRVGGSIPSLGTTDYLRKAPAMRRGFLFSASGKSLRTAPPYPRPA